MGFEDIGHNNGHILLNMLNWTFTNSLLFCSFLLKMNFLASWALKGMRSFYDKFKHMFLWYYWTAGPPDVEQPCDPSLQAWSPELSLYDTNLTSPCPNTEGCTLTLHFLHPLVPHSLTLWVTYMSSSKCNSRDYLNSVQGVDRLDCFTSNTNRCIGIKQMENRNSEGGV